MSAGRVSALALACIATASLATLIAIQRGCAPRAMADDLAVERLVDPERLAGHTTAALTLESQGAAVTYLRAKGLWRCREAFGAVCVTEEVENLIASVLDTRGVLTCDGAECAARCGIDEPDVLRLALHGAKILTAPDRDTLVELAFAPSRGNATFAAAVGSERVLSVDRDPRALLDTVNRPAPLVDTRVLAGCFAPGFAGFRRMFVDRGDNSIDLSSADPETSGVDRTWQIEAEGTRRDALVWRVGGYVSLWVRLRWDRAEDPRTAAALGLDPAFATITLAPNIGEPFEIRVSAPDPANRVHLWNRATNVVASVRAELLPLLVPVPADFTRAEGGNPWESWLAPR